MPATPLHVKIRLGTMMFLQFAINGVWSIPLVTCLAELKYSESDTALVYTTFAWGAIGAPLFVGMIADRFFASEKILAVLNLLGGVLLYLATLAIGNPRMFFWALLAHCLCYFPTWSLTNSIALAHARDPDREFPIIRLMGTIGWIAVSAISLAASFYQWNIEKTVWPLWIGAGLAIVAGIYNFFLPHTPPQAAGKKVRLGEVLGLPALALLRDRNFAVLMFTSFLIMLPAAFFWTWGNDFLNEIGMESAQFKQSIGQMAEVLFIFLLPVFFMRYLSFKSIFLLGLAAWAARYALLAFSSKEDAAIYVALLLHGACFAFIFVLGPMYADRKAPKELQASAQGLLTLVTWGLGLLVGTALSGQFLERYKLAERVGEIAHDWRMFWLWAALMSAAVAVVFAALFRGKYDVTSPVQEAPAGNE
ncbi:MAG: MFS transporter [Thermoguttaceae bacterium]|jgi:nucleoside transporter